MTYRPEYMVIAGERVEVASLNVKHVSYDPHLAVDNRIDPDVVRALCAPMPPSMAQEAYLLLSDTRNEYLSALTVTPRPDLFAWFWTWLSELFTPPDPVLAGAKQGRSFMLFDAPDNRVTSRTVVISRMGFGGDR